MRENLLQELAHIVEASANQRENSINKSGEKSVLCEGNRRKYNIYHIFHKLRERERERGRERGYNIVQ